MTARPLSSRIAAPAVIVLFLAIVLVPFLSLLLAALQPAGTPLTGLALPRGIHLENFAHAWSAAGFGVLLRSSAVIAVSVVPAAVLCATLAGYALATMDVPGRGKVYGYLLLGLSIPTEGTVIALYYDMRAVGLTNTVPGLALAEIGAFMPFGVFWMRAHFAAMPRSLIEAARLDGASSWTTLWRVLMPSSRPAVVTLGVLYFVWSWNQFLLPLILIQDPDRRTAPAGLGFFTGQYGVDVPLLAAATLIVIAPVVLVYLFFQRHFINGVLSGALKG
ncbi:carbohydrate ABC transporter permease [Streptomyces sporangiiformans]|uniref:Carbohydrate ABC transporter permease n=1 Tax=Streptomyces sporangiiformans TaxID=2315329 RepID=A0A505DBU6_9ACTN|nr:carbohydrate ABC transporter permease [Streptomyces sporangiiformans]TPQ16766.1 carbohydrate ABC transporter permease [Streptomyces sporangiiformans]